MPVIACPGCGKKYKLPDSAAGQVAKCACGKRFRLSAAPATTPVAKVAADPAPKAAPTKVASASTSKSVPAKPVPAKVSSAPASKPVPKPSAAQAQAPDIDDDFWNDALGAESQSKPLAAPLSKSSPRGAAQPAMDKAAAFYPSAKPKEADPPKKKKRKKSGGGFHWGADWGKVGGGLLTFLVCGGITVAMVTTTGRISIYLAVVAVGGLFTALSGLMGD